MWLQIQGFQMIRFGERFQADDLLISYTQVEIKTHTHLGIPNDRLRATFHVALSSISPLSCLSQCFLNYSRHFLFWYHTFVATPKHLIQQCLLPSLPSFPCSSPADWLEWQSRMAVQLLLLSVLHTNERQRKCCQESRKCDEQKGDM